MFTDMAPAPSPITPPPRLGPSDPVTSTLSESTPVQSTDLFKGHKWVVIEHNGTRYRLQTTKLGKLILTK